MPTLTRFQQIEYVPYPLFSSDSRFRSPLHGSVGQELTRLEEEVSNYWRVSCEQIHVLREAHETMSYQAMPPNRTFTASIRYHLRGRGEPLPYQIDDE